MTREFVSKRTRNEFREFLVGWTLHEIKIEFEGANIEWDRDFEPDVSGQRRSFVEQFYRTLDFTNPADVKRLLAAYQSIIERAERNRPTNHGREEAERAIEQLKACLAKDGFAYDSGSIMATNSESRVVLNEPQSISASTRRALFDELIVGKISWSGRLSESDFLARLYDIDKMPSHDSRFDSMRGDIWQHRSTARATSTGMMTGSCRIVVST